MPIYVDAPPWRRLAGAFAVVLATMLTPTLGAQTAQPLPDGAGRETVRTKCLTCHEADLIQQQRLSKAGWIRELEKMGRWGAVLSAQEREQTADYLARHYGPGQTSRDSGDGRPTSAGSAVLSRRCLGCHQADLIEQQRLGEAAWGREIDKMVRWGAVVSDTERTDLVRHLVDRFGPR